MIAIVLWSGYEAIFAGYESSCRSRSISSGDEIHLAFAGSLRFNADGRDNRVDIVVL